MELTTENNTNAPGCDATPTTLQDLERIIEEGEARRKASYEEMGKALFEIKSRGLYKETPHRTWQDYVTTRWGFSRQRAHQLIQAWLEAETSTTVNKPKPKNEREARARQAAKSSPKETGKGSPPKETVKGSPQETAKGSPQETAKAGIVINLESSPQETETAKGGIVHSLDAEVEEFRKKVVRWKKFLSTPDFKQLLEAIELIIDDELSLLEGTQAAAA
jgi:hypothetical protein